MSYQTPLTSKTSYGVVKVGDGIDVTNGVISVSPYSVPTYVVLGASPTYTLTTSDYYVGVIATGVATLTLPLTPPDGTQFIIKAEFGNTANIQVSPTAGDFIEGSAGGYLIDIGTSPYSFPSVTLVYRVGNNNWNVV